MEELAKYETKTVDIWRDPDEIKKLFAPALSTSEFQYFMGIAKHTGANPFLKEIFAVKYKKKDGSFYPAQVIHGRDFYRRKAQELKEYERHYADAVYSNDEFSVSNGVPSHSYNLKDRGQLVGAYCCVFKKGIAAPFYNFVEFKEYQKTGGLDLWKTIPATMIKKVAESQGLRGAFQGTFQGSYDESELWEENQNPPKQALPDDGGGLHKAWGEIGNLIKNIPPDTQKFMFQKHLDSETLDACRDIRVLRDFYRYVKDNIEEMEGAQFLPEELDDMQATISHWQPENEKPFQDARKHGETNACLSYFHAALDKKDGVQEETNG